MKPLALNIRSCSCRIASWSVAAIAVDDEMKLWRDLAALSRAAEPAARIEPTTPTTTSAAVTPAHARWRFGPTTAPEPDAPSDNLPRRALISISRLEDGNRGGLARTCVVKAVDLGSRRVIQVPSTSVTTGPWSIGRSES